MKRLIAAFLLCSLFLAGCSTPAADPTEPSEEIVTVSPNEYLACVALTSYSSLEEYNAFIEKDGDKLPEDFFTWEDAAVFGEVICLVLLGESRYLYAIQDSANCKFCINIDRYPKSNTSEIVSRESVSINSDFRKATSQSGQSFRFARGDIQYGVYNGNISSITLYKNGVEIRIWDNIEGYPTNRTDTVLGKLLSPDDAVANAAFAELTEKLSK